MKTEFKIIGGISLLTIVLFVGSIFLFSSKNASPRIPNDQIVVRNGLHWHPRLSIYINGEKQEIPANVGLGSVHREIHTHEDIKEDIIHMEMAGVVTRDETRLGNFFKIWGKDFSSKKIFDQTSGSGRSLKMSVNGKENLDFENYEMKDNDVIEIKYE